MFSEHHALPDSFDYDLQAVRAALTDGERRKLEEKVNVLGTGLGPRLRNGTIEEGSPPTLIVFVTPKVPEEELDPEDVVPKEITLGDVTVETDVQETGGRFEMAAASGDEKHPSPARSMRVRPLLGGISAGPDDQSVFGTITGKFYDSDGDAVVLTARHVLSGRTIAEPRNRLLVQPSGVHTDSPETVGEIKQFSEWHVDSTAGNRTDVATVRVSDDNAEGIYLGYDRATSTGQTQADRRLVEISASRGLRSGELLATDVQTDVGYADDRTVRFRGLESYAFPIGSGASGSAIGHIDPRTRELTITGISLGGTSQRTIATPWQAIEDEFGELTPAQEVGSEPPTDTDPTEPDVDREPGELALTVRDSETNDPIQGASVSVNGTSTTTDSSGLATVTLDAGEYDVEVVAEGYSSSVLSYSINWDERLERSVSLIPQTPEDEDATVTVRVHDEDGTPLEGASVTVTREGTAAVVRVQVQDEDGNALEGASVSIEPQ